LHRMDIFACLKMEPKDSYHSNNGVTIKWDSPSSLDTPR
jgi:hypothetical protein